MASIFSRIVSGEIPSYRIAEDEHHLAFLDINPVQRAHTLVIPKKETDYVFDMTPEEISALILFAKKVAHGIEKVVTCERIGVSIIGLEVPHAHVHLIPINTIADMNFERERINLTDEEMKSLAKKISEQL